MPATKTAKAAAAVTKAAKKAVPRRFSAPRACVAVSVPAAAHIRPPPRIREFSVPARPAPIASPAVDDGVLLVQGLLEEIPVDALVAPVQLGAPEPKPARKRIRRPGSNKGMCHHDRVAGFREKYLRDHDDNRLSEDERAILASYVQDHDPSFFGRLRGDGYAKDAAKFHVGFRGHLDRGDFGTGGVAPLSEDSLKAATAELTAMATSRRQAQRQKPAKKKSADNFL